MLSFSKRAAKSAAIQLPGNSAFPDRAPTAAWALTGGGNGTITPNFAPGPDRRPGAQMASRIAEGSGLLLGPNFNSAATYNASAAQTRMTYFVKPYGPGKRILSLYAIDTTTGTKFTAIAIDLNGGSFVEIDQNIYNVDRYEIVRHADGWFQVRQYLTLAAESCFLNLYAADNKADFDAAAAYTGDGVSGFLLWGIDIRVSTDATG